jgi:hypothetical protein
MSASNRKKKKGYGWAYPSTDTVVCEDADEKVAR